MFHTCIDCKRKCRHATESRERQGTELRCLVCHRKHLEAVEAARVEEMNKQPKSNMSSQDVLVALACLQIHAGMI